MRLCGLSTATPETCENDTINPITNLEQMKYSLFLVTLLALPLIWSCSTDGDNGTAVPTIALTNPADNARVDLSAAASTVFGWRDVDGIDGYRLVMSLSAELSAPQNMTVGSNPFYLTAADFDAAAAALGIGEGARQRVYWSVVPADPKQVKTEVRSIDLTRAAAPISVIALLAPADDAAVDLNDNSLTVEFAWTKPAKVTRYTVCFSLSQELDDAVVVDAGDLGSLKYASAEAFDAVLAGLGLKAGEEKTVYWSVVPAEAGYEGIETQVRSIRARRIAQRLKLPEKDASIVLEYTPEGVSAPDPVRFEWADAGADDYQVAFSTKADMSDPVTVGGVAATSRSFTHTELQELLIEPDAFGLRRYRPNTLYWNVRADGEWMADEASSFSLNGMMVFVDKRNNGQEVNVYRVAAITTAGYQATWMAEDLRTLYSADGQDLTLVTEDSGNEFNRFAGPGRAYEGQAAGSANEKVIPKYFLDRGTIYYRCSAATAGYLSAGDWVLPTLAEWTALFDAAGQAAEGGGCYVLKDYDRYAADEHGTPTFDYQWSPAREEWNTWKMNMGPNGRFYYGYNTYVYFNWGSDFGGGGNSAHEMFYAYDYGGDAAHSGKFFYYWSSEEPPYSSEGATGWWGTANSLVPARLIYKGR